MTPTTVRTVTAMMQPALVVHPELQPKIPTWWPPAPTDGTSMTEEDRHRARAGMASREARRGPWDGQKYRVDYTGERPPQTFARDDAPGFVYELAVHESTGDRLVYRFAPHLSPSHARMMRNVEEAYAEAGPDYAAIARLGDRPEETS